MFYGMIIGGSYSNLKKIIVMKNFMFTLLGIAFLGLSCSKKDTSYQNSGIDSSTINQDSTTTNGLATPDTSAMRNDTATTRIDSVQRR